MPQFGSRLDGDINSFCQVYEEEALAEAEQMEREAVRGDFRGPFHGVPIGVKDLFAVKDTVTGRGSKVFRDHVSTETAPIVERCFRAGAIMLGKTTTPEFGWKGGSTSPLYGVTRNPYDLTKTSGGSSSGSAAAVAARLVPAALGSDGGGSLRIPASFCGIFSMKGSLGRIPTWPWSATEHFSHAGVMTRTVTDSALMMDVLKGPDPRCQNCLPAESKSYQDVIRTKQPRLHCAFVPTLFDVSVDDRVNQAVRKTVEAVRDANSMSVEEISLDLDKPDQLFETVWVAGRGVVYGETVQGKEGDLDPGFLRIVQGANRYSLADFLHALQKRASLIEKVNAIFDSFDILLMPTIPVLPFEAEKDSPCWVDPEPLVPWIQWTPFTYLFNITGHPAASIPAGFTDQTLPVGLQVVGRRFDDANVLRVCSEIEKISPWIDNKPSVCA